MVEVLFTFEQQAVGLPIMTLEAAAGLSLLAQDTPEELEEMETTVAAAVAGPLDILPTVVMAVRVVMVAVLPDQMPAEPTVAVVVVAAEELGGLLISNIHINTYTLDGVELGEEHLSSALARMGLEELVDQLAVLVQRPEALAVMVEQVLRMLAVGLVVKGRTFYMTSQTKQSLMFTELETPQEVPVLSVLSGVMAAAIRPTPQTSNREYLCLS